MLNIFEKEQKYIGHNPPASYVMLAILLFTFIIIITGALTYGIQEDKGIFATLSTTSLKNLELFESLHELFATILYFLIGAHLLGILTDKLLHKEHETLNSIINGYKNTKEENNIKLTLFQKIFSILCLFIFLLFLAYNIYNPSNILVS
jgi:Ni,Fe-hydrogenase I cytochrome b subunit